MAVVLAVAVSIVALPSTVGPLLAAPSSLMAASATVMTTVSGLLASPRLSVTVRLNSSTVGLVGAINLRATTSAVFNPTGSPALCVQLYPSGRLPSGSKDPLPVSVNC